MILVCREGQQLPFDITGFNCIFFDLSSLAGKKKFRAALSCSVEAFQDPDEPTIIRGKLQRTESIGNDLLALQSLPPEILRRSAFGLAASCLRLQSPRVRFQTPEMTIMQSLS